MSDQLSRNEAARALEEIQRRQGQVIDLATIPRWYWWAVGGLMVALAAGVDTRAPVAVGVTVSVFVLGILATSGTVAARAYRRAQLRNGLLAGRGVVAILSFVALITAGTIGIALWLRQAGVGHPATLACLVGGLAMGLGGPALTRLLRRIMLGNRAGSGR